jgi:hypothetical protein
MNDFESDCLDLGEAFECFAGSHHTVDTLADSGWVVGTLAARLGDPLDAAFPEDGFRRHIKYSILEGGTSDIGD